MFTRKLDKFYAVLLVIALSFGISNADDYLDVKTYINNMRNATTNPGILGDVFIKVFDEEGKIKEGFLNFVNTATNGYIPVWKNNELLDSPLYSTGGLVGIGTTTLTEKLNINGGLSITKDPDSGDDVGDRAYNDGRYLNVGETLEWMHSGRNFPNGTLVETDIDYSNTNGEPWVLEIKGNSYGSGIPFDIQYQGYIYSDTIINRGGISNGTSISGLVVFNYNGHLTFWFPYQVYWQGFNMVVYGANSGTNYNRILYISNLAKPVPITKELALSSTIRQSWHTGNDGIGSGLSADNLDGLDSLAFQKRVSGECVAGESIRVINDDGTVVCEVDDSATVNTTNYITRSDGTNLVDSSIYQSGALVGIGTTTPSVEFEVAGDARANSLSTACIGNCGTAYPALVGTDSTVSGNLIVDGDISSTTGDVSTQNLNASGNVTAANLDVSGDTIVNGELNLSSGHIVRQSVVQVNTANHSTTTAWKLGPVFTTISDFKAGSKVKLSYHIPMRNDSGSWGGGYIEPQISFNGGSTWNSLGSSGYDGAVMNSSSPSIGSYFNTLLIDPSQVSDYSVTVRFYFRSYDGTVMINQSHSINTVSGTATLMSGVNGTQHFSKIIVEELY